MFQNPRSQFFNVDTTSELAFGCENLALPEKEILERIDNENSAQGAAEYILLFGGVIVIALAGLLIYRSYFASSASGLNATKDINSIRDNMTSLQI